MDRPTCATCVYFEPTIEDDGVCRRRAPNPDASNNRSDDRIRAEWPDVEIWDWCGEHTDFPAFIESRKSRPQDKRGDVRLVAVIRDDPYTDEPVTISREETERIASLFASEPTTPPTAPPSPPPTTR